VALSAGTTTYLSYIVCSTNNI